MPLTLKELMQKAEKKGFKPNSHTTDKTYQKTWQQESVIYNQKHIDKYNKTTNSLSPEPQKKSSETENQALREHCVSIASSKPLANREHCVSKPLANREHCVSIASSKPLAEPLANREHCVSTALANTDINIDKNIDILVGKERVFLQFLFKKCQSIGSLETQPITTEELRNNLDISAEHLRNLIYRLTNKGFLQKTLVKNGKSGWRKFYLSKELFQNFFLNSSVSIALANHEHCVSIASSKPLAEPLANIPNNSSIYNNKLIITSDTGSLNNLSQEWKDINYESLKHIGFSETQLLQLYSKKLNPEIIQESINHFAFGLENSEKTKAYNNPLFVLMGVLRKGQAWTEDSYESATDRALRMLLERRKQADEKRNKIYNEFFDLEYKKWFNMISDDGLTQLLPKINLRFGRYVAEIENQARVAFRQTQWEEIYEEIKKQTEK